MTGYGIHRIWTIRPSSLCTFLDIMLVCTPQIPCSYFGNPVHWLSYFFTHMSFKINWVIYGGYSKYQSHPQTAFKYYYIPSDLHWWSQALKYAQMVISSAVSLQFWTLIHQSLLIFTILIFFSYSWPSPTIPCWYHNTIQTLCFERHIELTVTSLILVARLVSPVGKPTAFYQSINGWIWPHLGPRSQEVWSQGMPWHSAYWIHYSL